MNSLILILSIINFGLIISLICYIYRTNEQFVEYTNQVSETITSISRLINESNQLSRSIASKVTANRCDLGQVLSKLDSMNESKTKKPTLKITKTKKANKTATKKTAKPKPPKKPSR